MVAGRRRPHGRASTILRVSTDDGDAFEVVVRYGGDADFRIQTTPDPNRFFVVPTGLLVDVVTRSVEQPEIFDGHSPHYAVPVRALGGVVVGHCCRFAYDDTNGLCRTAHGGFCCEDPVFAVDGDDLVVDARECGTGSVTMRYRLADGVRLSRTARRTPPA